MVRNVKHELFDCQSCENSTNSSPKFIRKNNAHLSIDCKYFYKRSSREHPPQEVRFSITQRQINGNFTPPARIHQCVHFSVENFLFSSFLQRDKKVKARCIKQKSKGCGRASAGGSGSEAAPARSLSQASYSDRRGGRGGGGGRTGGGGWGQGHQRRPLPLLLPSDPHP